jgi:glycosyltransferase involved in cell wall biosynthesis
MNTHQLMNTRRSLALAPTRPAIATETVIEIVHPESSFGNVVTVAVSLYNYANFIGSCLDSIFAQTYGPIDLIVVDDASTKDQSLTVARDWLVGHAERFERVLLLEHKRNQGLAMARNTAFSRALGDSVFVIDADNTIYPRAIARLYEVLRNSGVGAAYSQLEFFGSERRLGHADVWSPEGLKYGNYIDAMALVSKSAWRRVGGYSHIEGGLEDYDFWCKFVEHNIEAAYVPEILCSYRVHPTSMLRTETEAVYRELFIQLSSRHPWLELRFTK